MSSFYKVIEIESGNVLGDYDNTDEALEALAAVVQEHGNHGIVGLSLIRIDGDRQSLVAAEDGLIELVAAFRSRPVVSAASSS